VRAPPADASRFLQIHYRGDDQTRDQVTFVSGARRYVVAVTHLNGLPDRSFVIGLARQAALAASSPQHTTAASSP
jgi:hypothetical protein